MSIASLFASAWRDYVTDGVPASGPNEPAKSEIRAIGAAIDSSLASLSLGSVSVTKDTRAHLDADLAHAADATALVYADATDANNDIYVKVGASGSGSWTLTGILHDAISGVTQPFVDDATDAATLAGHYANDDTDTDVPGGAAGERGAKYWNAQAQAGADAAASAAASAATAALQSYASSFKAAIGASATQRALVDFDGPRTAYSGSPTIMTALASLDATPLSAGLHSSIYSGSGSLPGPRPVYTSRGLEIGSQAGLQVTSGLAISSVTGGLSLYYAGDLNIPLFATVNLATDRDALTGMVEGDTVHITADVNTTASNVANAVDQLLVGITAVNGYWKRGFSTWAVYTQALFSILNSGNTKWLRAIITPLGQLQIDYYPYGTGGTVYSIISKGTFVYGAVPAFAVDFRNNMMMLTIDGYEPQGMDITGAPDVTDFTKLYINGTDRSASTATPITAGLHHYFKGLAIAEKLTVSAFRSAYNVFMGRHGKPLISRPRKMLGTVFMGHSLAAGFYTTNVDNMQWTTTEGWNGQFTLPSAYDIENFSPTREAFPGCYSHRDTDHPGDIAPLGIRAANATIFDALGSHRPGSKAEGHFAGYVKQLMAHPLGRANDHIFHELNFSGITLAQLAAEPNVYSNEQLKTVYLGGSELLARLKRQIIYARDWATLNGQEYQCDSIFGLLVETSARIYGFSDVSTWVTDFLTFYDAFNAWVKAATGQTNDVRVIMAQSGFSYKGKGSTIIKANQRALDLEDARGTRPIFCSGGAYQRSNFLHKDALSNRAGGEDNGLAYTRAFYDGIIPPSMRPYRYRYSVGGTTVDIDYRVLTGRKVTFADTNEYNIDARQTFNGVDTYGYALYTSSSDITINIGTGVFTWTAGNHGLSVGDKIFIETIATGAVQGVLPTGTPEGVVCYVQSVPTSTTFTVSLTNGGAAVSLSGTQSGTHTCYALKRTITGVSIPSATATITIANPGVITATGLGLTDGCKIVLSTTGTLPAALPAGEYFLRDTGTAGADTFHLATQAGGASIITTGGTQSGTHTVTSASTVRITTSAAIVAGDTLDYVGFACRFGNLCDGAKVDGLYKWLDPSQPLTSGAIGYAEGLANDVRQVAAASRKVL